MVHFILKKEIGKQMDTCNMKGFINELEAERIVLCANCKCNLLGAGRITENKVHKDLQ